MLQQPIRRKIEAFTECHEIAHVDILDCDGAMDLAGELALPVRTPRVGDDEHLLPLCRCDCARPEAPLMVLTAIEMDPAEIGRGGRKVDTLTGDQ